MSKTYLRFVNLTNKSMNIPYLSREFDPFQFGEKKYENGTVFILGNEKMDVINAFIDSENPLDSLQACIEGIVQYYEFSSEVVEILVDIDDFPIMFQVNGLMVEELFNDYSQQYSEINFEYI